jgi:two-component system response regulator YesN
MYKVMIAEDEKWIRAGLLHVIDWNSLHLGPILEAGNGKEALLLAEKEHPDLVIADIKMPEMTGLEMIEKLRERSSEAVFIVISGFSEFSYAQRAISCGVSEYLLKPVSKEKLLHALNKSIHELDARRENRKEKAHPDSGNLSGYLNIIQNHYLHEIIYDGKYINDEQCHAELEKAGIRSRNKTAVMMVFRFLPMQTTAEKLGGILRESFPGDDEYYFFGSSENELYGLCLTKETLNVTALKDMLDQLKTEHHCRISAGTGSQVNISQMGISYDQAMSACDWGYFSPGEHDLIVWEEEPADERKEPRRFASLSKDTILNLMVSGDPDKLNIYLDDGSEKLKEAVTRENAAEMRQNLILTIEQAFKEYKVRGFLNPDIDIQEQVKRIKYQLTLSETVKMLKQVLKMIVQSGGPSENASGRLIKHAVWYVHEHYRENITMNEMAGQMNLNASYFSHVFSEGMHMPFIRYVNTYRISVAKQLLSDPAIKIYEIAELVGFDDYRYFSRIFKSIEKVTPEFYRENILSYRTEKT